MTLGVIIEYIYILIRECTHRFHSLHDVSETRLKNSPCVTGT